MINKNKEVLQQTQEQKLEEQQLVVVSQNLEQEKFAENLDQAVTLYNPEQTKSKSQEAPNFKTNHKMRKASEEKPSNLTENDIATMRKWEEANNDFDSTKQENLKALNDKAMKF